MDQPYLTQRLVAIQKTQGEAEKKRLISELVKEFSETTLKVAVENLKDTTNIENFDEVKAHLRNELKPLLKALKDLNLTSREQGKIAQQLEQKGLQSMRDNFDMVMIRKPKTVDVNVLNQKDFPKDISVNNLKDYTEQIGELAKLLKEKFKIDIPTPKVTVTPPTVNVPETRVEIPPVDLSPLKDAIKQIKTTLQGFKRPTNPMAVRLTDGEEFLESLRTMVDNQQTFFDGSANNAPLLRDIKSRVGTAGTIVDGTKTITTAGTAVQITATATPCKKVWLNADLGNTNPVVVGGSTVDATAGSMRGIILIPANPPVEIEIDDLSKLYVDAQTNGDEICFVYVR